MIPILYPSNETDFTTQGLGALGDTVSVKIDRVVNGKDELTMVYPSTGIRYADLANDCIIYAQPEYRKDPQPYQIYQITKPLNGMITVYARQVCAQRAAYIPVNPFSAGSAAEAFVKLPNYLAENSPFTFYTTKTTTANFNLTRPASLGKVLGGMEGSVLDVFGGEYEFDKYQIKLLTRRGTDRAVTLRYGKNITSIEQSESYSSIVTGIVPYWEGMDGTVVKLPETVIEGQYADTYAYRRTIVKDFSDAFDEQPTVEQLRAKANAYIASSGIGLPSLNLKVSFEHLAQYTGYENLQLLETVNLGDTIHVYYEPLGIEATARIVKTSYDCLNEKYISVQVGSVKSDLEQVMNQTAKEVSQVKATVTQGIPSAIDAAVEHATEMITGVDGGHYVVNLDANGHPYETLWMDTDDKATATYVIRINKNGIGFSANGYNGPYTNAWTIDGQFVADFITAGTLNAVVIRAGVIADVLSKNYWNLDTGAFRITDGSIVITFTKTYKYTDYSQADLDIMQSFITGSITFTDEQWEKYSINGDGVFRMSDLILIRNMILNSRDIVKTITVTINPEDTTRAIKVDTSVLSATGNTTSWVTYYDGESSKVPRGQFTTVNAEYFGKYATETSAKFYGEIYPNQTINGLHTKISDFVIEAGYDSPWYWRKWNSGYAEAWARVAHTLNFSQAWGAVYVADIDPEAYPFTFRSGSQPIEQVSAVGATSGTDNSCWLCNYGGQTGPTDSQTGKYQAIRPVSGSATIRIAYYVRGLI